MERAKQVVPVPDLPENPLRYAGRAQVRFRTPDGNVHWRYAPSPSPSHSSPVREAAEGFAAGLVQEAQSSPELVREGAEGVSPEFIAYSPNDFWRLGSYRYRDSSLRRADLLWKLSERMWVFPGRLFGSRPCRHLLAGCHCLVAGRKGPQRGMR